MTKKQKAPQSTSDTTAAATQSWRDRLNTKLNAHPGTQRNTITPNASNRLGSTSPGSTSRKAKKGHRPG